MPTFPCPGPINLEVRIAAGEIQLDASPRDTAEVEITPYDDSDASRQAVEQTRVEFTGDRLVIASPEAGGWAFRWRMPRLRVTARVPAGSNATLKSAAADTGCRGDWGTVNLSLVSGDGIVDRIGGDLTVNSASGDLRVAEIGGRFTVKTASGDLSAGRIGGSVDIKAASGNVQLDRAESDVSVKTAAGDVRVGAASHGSIRVTTVSGDISVGVVSGTGVWLDLNSLTGNAHSDLNMTGGTESHEPTGHKLSIQARAVSGNIEIHRVTLPTAPSEPQT